MRWYLVELIFINPFIMSNYWIMLMLHYREDRSHIIRDFYDILVSHFPEYR